VVFVKDGSSSLSVVNTVSTVGSVSAARDLLWSSF